jgi:hypothetical protein
MGEFLAAIVVAFLQDEKTLIVLGLIALDILTGMMGALRRGAFEFNKVGRFYLTMVLPYLLGYSVVYVLSAVGLRGLPTVGPILEQVGQYGGFAALLSALLPSIGDNLKELQAPPKQGPE